MVVFLKVKICEKNGDFQQKFSHRCYSIFSSHVFNFILLINLDINIFMSFFDKVGEVILRMYKSSCLHITLERVLKISPLP